MSTSPQSDDPAAPSAQDMDQPGAEVEAPAPLALEVAPEEDGRRLDRFLTEAAPASAGFSRSGLRRLIESGAVTGPDGAPATSPSAKVRAFSVYVVAPPPPAAAAPEAEDIPLSIAYEDAHLIVVDKPAGMVVHPAPGAPNGTLVNALLHHCGDSLAGIGGEMRPGVVHRIDKDTSGLIVAAKTEIAHRGLAAQFAAHDLERSYLAVVWGKPDRAEPRLAGAPGVSFEPGGWMRVDAAIARHPADRKKMAVRPEGRRAVTRVRVEAAPADGAVSLLRCRLETGRTHQIRVHLAQLGHGLVGDATYGKARRIGRPAAGAPAWVEAASAFPRQALHAATLGFVHPATGESLRFERAPPGDLAALIAVFAP